MAIIARLSRTWIRRQTIIGAVALAVGCWFFYDGAVTYPKSNERFRAYTKFVQEGNETAWPTYAKEHHWNERPPEKEYRITDQWVLGTAAVLGSMAAFGLLLASLKRTVSSDGETVTASNGSRVPIRAIRSTDRRKWQSKGIAYAHYDSNGKQARLKLDDFKYAGAEDILKEVEADLATRTTANEAAR